MFNRTQLIISQISFSVEVLWLIYKLNTYSTLYLFCKNVNDISSYKESEVLTCLVQQGLVQEQPGGSAGQLSYVMGHRDLAKYPKIDLRNTWEKYHFRI